MRLVTGLAISLLLSGAAYADDYMNAFWDTRDLLSATLEATKALEELTERWDGGASLETERQLRSDVLGPLEAAMYKWSDFGMRFGIGGDNPYRQFMPCYDLSDQVKLTTIQLIHFHGGGLAPEEVELDGELLLEGLEACKSALRN